MRQGKTIDAAGIARLAGSKTTSFAHNKRRDDHTFPKPVSGGIEGERILWLRAEIMAWLSTYKRTRFSANERAVIDNGMAQLVIRKGWRRAGRELQRANKYGGLHYG